MALVLCNTKEIGEDKVPKFSLVDREAEMGREATIFIQLKVRKYLETMHQKAGRFCP